MQILGCPLSLSLIISAIRFYLQYGWEGVDFYNGIALTKKTVGDSEWDWDSESFIP